MMLGLWQHRKIFFLIKYFSTKKIETLKNKSPQGDGSINSQDTVEVSPIEEEEIVKLTPGVLAVIDKIPGPPLGTLLVRKISVFAVTVLLFTTTTEGDSKTGVKTALPIRALVPSLIRRPDPTRDIAIPEIDALVFNIRAISVNIVVLFVVTEKAIAVPLLAAVQVWLANIVMVALDVVEKADPV